MAIYDNILIKVESEDIDQRAAFAALKRLEGEHKRRIHQRGQGTNGRQLKTFSKTPAEGGFYSKQHARRRRRFGRKIDKKDLQLFGDLIRSYTVGQFKNKYVYGFLNDRSRLIAEGQQGQTRQDIFRVSKAEAELVSRIYSERVVNDIFR